MKAKREARGEKMGVPFSMLYIYIDEDLLLGAGESHASQSKSLEDI